MTNFNSILTAIFTSLIASIIFSLASGFIKRKSNQLLDWFATKNKNYSDKFYSNISKNTSSIIENFVVFFLFFLIIFGFEAMILKLDEKYKIYKKLATEVQNVKGLDYKQWNNLYDDIMRKDFFERSEFARNNVILITAFEYVLIVIFLIFIIWYYFKIIGGIRIKRSNADFSRRLDMISPYISTNEILMLKSKWVTMKNREDFVEIQKEINDYIGTINLQNDNSMKIDTLNL